MNRIDILCQRISSAASELFSMTGVLNSTRQMTMAEVDLLSAERHLKDALQNVHELLAEYQKGREAA